MSEQHRNFPEYYITAPQTCPYLPGQFERKLFTHITHDKPPALIDNLLRNGFRRSENVAYMPYCDGCSACISVRVVAGEFVPTKSMRRIMVGNHDVVARRLPSVPTAEQYALFRSYIQSRHNDGGMVDMTVLDFAMMIEDSIIDTRLTEYRLRPQGVSPTVQAPPRGETWPLIGVALTDRLADGVSMVYSFYDPTMEKRSLGSYMILEHIQHMQAEKMPYLYLGYWIAGSKKMAYKSRFRPQEQLSSHGWMRTAF